MLDSEERQELFSELVDLYRSDFGGMSDEERSMWFFTMDESVILSYLVEQGQTIPEAEQRHAVKLLAIAHALMALPCAEKEKATIDDLTSMANEIGKRVPVF